MCFARCPCRTAIEYTYTRARAHPISRRRSLFWFSFKGVCLYIRCCFRLLYGNCQFWFWSWVWMRLIVYLRLYISLVWLFFFSRFNFIFKSKEQIVSSILFLFHFDTGFCYTNYYDIGKHVMQISMIRGKTLIAVNAVKILKILTRKGDVFSCS